MLPRIWATTLLRLGLLAIAGLGIGWLYGHPLVGLLLVALLALGWNLVWLYRLDRWLRGRPMPFVPDGSGVWPQVFAKIDFLHTRIKRRGKRFKSLVKQMTEATRIFPDGGIVLNAQDEIVRMNHAAARLLGLKRKQDRRLRITTLLRDPQFAAYLQQQDFTKPVEFPFPPDTDQWRSCQLVPYGLERKLLLVRDISHERKADQMRRDFVANASHELRTPLTVISGYLDVLAADETMAPDLREPLQEMERQARRMKLLVNDLLKLSELEAKGKLPECKPVDLAPLVAGAVAEARAIADSSVDISVDLQSSARLLCEVNDLQSILSNLVSNAARYTPRGGRIAVTWRSDAAGGYLSVTDSGMGIAREHIPRLTERFYRVENGRERVGEQGGTGLGLAIVKHALQRYGAVLKIDSKPGEGSTFSCHFPAERVATVA